MARASRSNKKQPAFDPSELTDLIFTPAVGSGVGSHLVGNIEDFPAPDDDSKQMSKLSTVGVSDLTTVAITVMSAVDNSTTVDNVAPPTVAIMSTADIADLSTVANSEISTVDNMSTVEADISSTVDNSSVKPKSIWQGRAGDSAAVLPNILNFWITEQGSLVPEGSVKRIQAAQDVISASEKSIYDTLWTASAGDRSDGRDLFRVVQVGYDYLAKHTELSKRTVQRLVEKLIDKDFIAIERPADIYQRTSTMYRVFSHESVLNRHMQKGRSHVAKIGPGVSYVRPLRS